jgi:hypothetical protein
VTGREFAVDDSAGAPKVAIVNEAFARKFGFASQAVGKRISRGSRTYDIEIVGLVADAKHNNLTEAVAPMFFVPHAQTDRRPGFRAFFLRTSGRAAETMSAVSRSSAA